MPQVLSQRESAEGDSAVEEQQRPLPPPQRGFGASTRDESDDSSFSGDNEHILAECIQSGMPKAKEAARRKRPPRALLPRDELKTFALEGTPLPLSSATSLSDLTVDSPARLADAHCYTPLRCLEFSQIAHKTFVADRACRDEQICPEETTASPKILTFLINVPFPLRNTVGFHEFPLYSKLAQLFPKTILHAPLT